MQLVISKSEARPISQNSFLCFVLLVSAHLVFLAMPGYAQDGEQKCFQVYSDSELFIRNTVKEIIENEHSGMNWLGEFDSDAKTLITYHSDSIEDCLLLDLRSSRLSEEDLSDYLNLKNLFSYLDLYVNKESERHPFSEDLNPAIRLRVKFLISKAGF